MIFSVNPRGINRKVKTKTEKQYYDNENSNVSFWNTAGGN